MSSFDFSKYTIAELLDLKRRYDAGEFDHLLGGENILHPFLQRCKEQCVSETTPDFQMDPSLNNYTAISGSGRQFTDGTDCYFSAEATSKLIRSDYYNYQIDLNITYMKGVLATIHNGTDVFSIGDPLEVDFEGGQTNFTYNASHGNKVYVKFTADPNYDGNSFFMAQYGMRALPKGKISGAVLEEDDEEEYITYALEIVPQSKALTFSEKAIIGAFAAGIVAMCWRNCFPDACGDSCWGFCKREKRSPDPLEAEFDFKVR